MTPTAAGSARRLAPCRGAATRWRRSTGSTSSAARTRSPPPTSAWAAGYYTSYCDATYASYKLIVDNLISAGIATVIAAGNNGFTDGVSGPGCISSAITVGATSKTDTVASFSNVDDTLDFWAPGVSIQSSVPGTTYQYWNGTSMAAPHVAGAWAVLKSHSPGASVAQLRTALVLGGVPITAYGVTVPRIQIDAALTSLGPTPDFDRHGDDHFDRHADVDADAHADGDAHPDDRRRRPRHADAQT